MWMWLFKLRNDKIVNIDKLTGVITAEMEKLEPFSVDKPHSNGGMRAKLSDYQTKVF